MGSVLLTAIGVASRGWVGSSVPRKEDEALLTGRARFIDDLTPVAGIRFAAILRSQHPHARIVNIDISHALKLSGVRDVVTGKDIATFIGPVPSVVKGQIVYYRIALDCARFVGEQMAVVVADSVALEYRQPAQFPIRRSGQGFF